jgi:hypothetical protein
MTTYAWPDFCVNAFQMRVRPNVLTFTGPYTPAVQTLDLMGERWYISFDTTPGNTREGSGEREAFWDRLLGPVHRVAMWNLARPLPLGTMRGGYVVNVVNGALAAVNVVNGSLQPVTVIGGGPSLISNAPAGANTISMRGQSGRTLRAGDMLGIGGQLVRVVSPVTFDGTSSATVEFLPRLRTDVPAYTEIIYDKPTATFMLMADGVPTVNRPAKVYDGASVEMIETYIV